MTTSGIILDDTVTAAAVLLQKANSAKKGDRFKGFKGFFMKIGDGEKSVVLDTDGSEEGSYIKDCDLLQALEQKWDDGKTGWAAVMTDMKDVEGKATDCMWLLCWSPDTCGIKHKMLASSTKEAVRKGLEKILANLKSLTLNDREDLSVSGLLDKLPKSPGIIVEFDGRKTKGKLVSKLQFEEGPLCDYSK